MSHIYVVYKCNTVCAICNVLITQKELDINNNEKLRAFLILEVLN